MAWTPVEIVNHALARFGATPIQSLDEETHGGQAYQMVYDDTIDFLLAEHPWSFTNRTMELQRLNEPVDDWGLLAQGYTKVFAIPAGLGMPERVLADPRNPDRPFKDYRLEENRIYCNRDRLWAQIPLRSDPDVWPVTFRTAAIACLAAELVMPVSGNASIHEKMLAIAIGTPAENRLGGMLGAAKRADNRAKPSAMIFGDDPLTSARFGG